MLVLGLKFPKETLLQDPITTKRFVDYSHLKMPISLLSVAKRSSTSAFDTAITCVGKHVN